MTARYMLDTNMVSHIVRGRSLAARRTLAGLAPRKIACLSSIVEGELRYGLAKRPEATALRAATEAFLGTVQVLPWDSEAAAVYGRLRARQEAAGRILDHLDLLIAAHAIASGAILVTSDKVFGQVEELPGLVNWATDL